MGRMNTLLARRGCVLRYFTMAVVLFVSVSSSGAQETCLGQPVNGDCGSGQFFDLTESCCMQCKDCSVLGQDQRAPCNKTHNAFCVPFCQDFHFWSVKDVACVINCSSCPGGGCHPGGKACICGRCHEGADCSRIRDECVNQPEMSEPETEKNGSSLNPVSIGLIAIGVVIGIVMFSSCFLLFGLCTTKQRRNVESQGSENSESGLVTGRGFSNSTRSSYMSGMSGTTAFLNNQSMLELLRHSNTPISSVSGSSSVKSSPRSIRSSPRLVRTTTPVSTPEKLRENGFVTTV